MVFEYDAKYRVKSLTGDGYTLAAQGTLTGDGRVLTAEIPWNWTTDPLRFLYRTQKNAEEYPLRF